jgi:hypothetical protein
MQMQQESVSTKVKHTKMKDNNTTLDTDDATLSA